MASRKRNLTRNTIIPAVPIGNQPTGTVRRRTTGRHSNRGLSGKAQLSMGRSRTIDTGQSLSSQILGDLQGYLKANMSVTQVASALDGINRRLQAANVPL